MNGRPRRFGEDYGYGIAHLERFPEQYQRAQHRFSLANVDWAEYCDFCKHVLMIGEMYKGGYLGDKSTEVMENLAAPHRIPVYAFTPVFHRPPEVQAEIDRLNTAVLKLTRKYPLIRVNAQLRAAGQPRGEIKAYAAEKWWEIIVAIHSAHHQQCRKARESGDRLASREWVAAARKRGIWPEQPPPLLFDTDWGA